MMYVSHNTLTMYFKLDSYTSKIFIHFNKFQSIKTIRSYSVFNKNKKKFPFLKVAFNLVVLIFDKN